MSFSLLIIIFAVLFAFVSQRNKVPYNCESSGSISLRYYSFNKYLFCISFILLAGWCFLSKTGDDMPAYVLYYSTWSWSDLLDFSVEIGYKLLCIVLRFVIKNPYIGLGLIKILCIALVFQSLYLLKDRLSLGFAVLAYVCILYVHSFHLLRIMIAVGLVFLGFSYSSLGKNKLPII